MGERALREAAIYQDLILDHSKSPRGQGAPSQWTAQGQGDNPLCGDSVTVYLVGEDKARVAVRYEHCGCALSRASASILAEQSEGSSWEFLRQLVQGFRRAFGGGKLPEGLASEGLQALVSMNQYPVRSKCVLLPWEAVEHALKEVGEG